MKRPKQEWIAKQKDPEQRTLSGKRIRSLVFLCFLRSILTTFPKEHPLAILDTPTKPLQIFVLRFGSLIPGQKKRFYDVFRFCLFEKQKPPQNLPSCSSRSLSGEVHLAHPKTIQEAGSTFTAGCLRLAQKGERSFSRPG